MHDSLVSRQKVPRCILCGLIMGGPSNYRRVSTEHGAPFHAAIVCHGEWNAAGHQGGGMEPRPGGMGTGDPSGGGQRTA